MITIPKPDEIPVQYLRDHENFIAVTISGTKLDDGRMAFGFAYRSYLDSPDRSKGGSLAKKRMVGMLRAAQNGVQEIVRVAATPQRGNVVLKSFLGAEGELINQLRTLHLPAPIYRGLPEKVGRILVGLNRVRK